MAQHLSDEEQLESLKQWWKKNGTQLLLTVVLVVGGWFGWQQWQQSREQKAAQASIVYMEMIELAGQGAQEELTDENEKRLIELAESLRDDHGDSEYAQYATLMLARQAVLNDDLDAAAVALQTVIESSDDVELAGIARMRLARVEMARQNYTEGLTVLEVVAPPGMATLYAELRGDIYYLSDDYVAARAAYQSALNGLAEESNNVRPMLELKLNRVLAGEPAPVETKEES
ncbi:MAG: hypothetical protein DRR06_06775 [Gammaproteobacteria bacterium]|nr:MAG: hypothetical protein DRR06_06775 [Gammaproteobacteria bacterium]RLA51529.1 MAG: hypothetical protein DRR42_10100 [Gammaproteobacteria bacterium]